MSEHYHDVGDLRFLKEMGKLAPTDFNAWLNLDKIVVREDGAIPRKYRELIALAVAFTTQCPYCIQVHVKGCEGRGSVSRGSHGKLAACCCATRRRCGDARRHGAEILRSALKSISVTFQK